MLAFTGLLVLLTSPTGESAAAAGETIVVTATRQPQAGFALPAAIDAIGAREIREDNPQVNLSEALARVPGIVVQNRQNYAQDLQVSSRGFGARSSFGVRGVRLIADGIPATMPDGQGQAATFDLGSAERIEVLRGPFASLYGNSSGGVVQVFTADGAARPELDVTVSGGSHGQRRLGLRAGGEPGPFNAIVHASRYETDGYRAHSAARRDHVNAKVKASAAGGTLTLVVNALDQPESQDPLGLTRAQFEADPRQVDAAAIAFDTRKSVRQAQGGLVYELDLTPRDSLHARAYLGDRQVVQYLGLSGDTPLGSGGVVDLDRTYGGVGVRWTRRFGAGDEAASFTVGAEHDRLAERRRGFVNGAGRMGALRRDEDDRVSNADVFAQFQWHPGPRWVVSGGARHSQVRFSSADAYVTAQNPDDSGRVRFSRTTPVAGVLFKASPAAHLYANAGEGFETPTFAELAYRPGGATGLNFALRPARSRHAEAGIKVRSGQWLRADAALFRIETRDEIVTNSSAGGRTDFKNAGRTLRRGAELSLHARLPFGLEAHVAYTKLQAEFRDAFTTGSPPAVIPAGRKLPGVPATSAHGELLWRHGSGWHAAVEARHASRVFVNDANGDAAPAYTVASLRVGHEGALGRWRHRAFLRIDNATDRRYAGSVIVAEARGRYFEPAPGRGHFLGIELSRRF